MLQIRSQRRCFSILLLSLLIAGCRPQTEITLEPGRQFLPPAADACQFVTPTGEVIEIYSSQPSDAADTGSATGCGKFDALALPGGPGESTENPHYQSTQTALPELRIGFVNPLGLGGSSALPATGLALEQQLVSLEQVMDATLEGPRLLLGTSWGANMAALLAARDTTQPYLVVLESPGHLKLQAAPPGACESSHNANEPHRSAPCLELESRLRRTIKRALDRALKIIARQFELAGPTEAFSFVKETPLYKDTLNLSVNIRILRDFEDIRLAPAPHPATRFAVLRGAKDRIKPRDISGYEQIAPVISVLTLDGQGHVPERDDCPYVTALRDVMGLLDPRVQKRSCATFLEPVPGMEGGFVRRIRLGPPQAGPVE